MKVNEFQKQFEKGNTSAFSAPFWSWNGKMEGEELNRQLDSFHAQRIGGFIIHAREGLETPYLSKKWNALVKETVVKGCRLGMRPYIYDDEKWPSGMAGGKLTMEHPQYRAMAIVLTGEKPGKYAYCAKLHGKRIEALREGDSAMQGESVIHIDIQQSHGHDWYSGHAPADNLNPESVKAFIQMTHEQYNAVFDGALSGKVEGFFTDEPNFNDFFSSFQAGCPWLPWTNGFDEYFMQKRGYCLRPLLPYLFYEGEMAGKVRHDYWRTLTERFRESYFKQIYDWCEAKGVKSVGHLLFENGLCSQTRVCGAAMPQYSYLHIPGIDILGDRTEEYLTVKQCSSVAHQFGRAAISETYGCTGWEFSFESQKRLWDWQAVMGMTIRCQHLSQYTIKGLRKRDYPPVFQYQAPWWEHDHIVEAYCARMSFCASAGEVQRRILVLHPQSSVWMHCASAPDEDLAHFDGNMGWTDAHIMGMNASFDRINCLSQALLRNQCDFDFGDETILAEHGRVENGMLRVNRAKYDVILVPDVDTIFDSTLRLLREFEAAGGSIIWLNKLPGCVNAVRTDAISQAFPSAVSLINSEAAIKALSAYRNVHISDIYTLRAAPILTSWRQIEDGYLLIAVNDDAARGYRCKIQLPVLGKLEEYSLLTGEHAAVDTGADMAFYCDFAPADAKVFLVHTALPAANGKVCPAYHDVHESPRVIACLGPTARFTRTAPNALPLDRCQWRIKGAWSAEMSVWEAQKAFRVHAGFRPIHANGMPMRYIWLDEQLPSLQVELRFAFEIVDMPLAPVHLALEEADSVQVFLNGVECSTKEGWFIDRSIQKLRMENIHEGTNELRLLVNATQALELEDMYLIGDFALDMDRRIVREPDKLRLADWCMQGYPHYNGSMVYRFTFKSDVERARLMLGHYSASCVLVRVNGGKTQYIPWRAANKLAISLKKGENELEIELLSSNRNLLGPLHQPYQLCSRIDWRDFRTEDGDRTSVDPVLLPYGLLSQCYLLYDEA